MDPFTLAVLAEFTAGVLLHLGHGLRKKLRPTEKELALGNCLGAGIEAMRASLERDLGGNRAHAESVLAFLFRNREAAPYVAQEVAGLLRDQPLDGGALREILVDAGFSTAGLPDLDFPAAATAFERAFVQRADQEKELQGEIQIVQLRQLLQEAREQTAIQRNLATKLEQATGPKPQGPSPARRRYLEALRRECRDLHLVDLGGRGGMGGEEVTLDRVFIELDTRSHVAVENEHGEKRSRSAAVDLEELQPLPVLAAARRAKRLVLLGDPGSGKSSFVKELCFRLAQAQLEGQPGPFESSGDQLLPVYLELRPLARALAGEDLAGKQGGERRRRLAGVVARVLAETCSNVYAAPGFVAELDAELGNGRCLLVLDGLDEVPVGLRSRVREAVSAILSQAPERVIVTCRIRSYEGEAVLAGFEPHTLAPLRPEQIRRFVHAWYAALHELRRLRPDQHWRTLRDDLARAALDQGLGGLATNPMLLTTMALLHQEGAKLPPERARLFELALDVLALKWRGGDQRRASFSEALRALLGKNLELWQVLERLGYEVHQAEARAGAGRQGEGGTLGWAEAVDVLAAPNLLESRELAIELLAYVDQSAGVLIGRGGPPGQPAAYGFPHRFFQEYLAGRYLFRVDETADEIRRRAAEGDFWQQAVALGAEDYLYCNKAPGAVVARARLLCPAGASTAKPQEARVALWAGSMANLVGEPAFAAGDASFIAHLQGKLVEVLTGSALPARERVEAGRLLGKLGDPRDELSTIEDMELCWVPDGPFFMGAAAGEGEAREDELPAGDYEIPYAYWVGRHPVTQRQFARFVADGGAEAPRNGEPFDLPNHPVVEITWHEALAYCRWLTAKARAGGLIGKDREFVLPSEPEWEKAARGGREVPVPPVVRRLRAGLGNPPALLEPNRSPRRLHPFEAELGPELANYDETGVDSTTAPGCFSAGESPYGCQDLAGNVWEWTRSTSSEKGPYPSEVEAIRQREALDADQERPRVLRGGSFAFVRRFVRCSARNWFFPNYRGRDFGFRVVLLPYFSEL